MSRKARLATTVSALIACAVFGWIFWTEHKLQQRIDELEPQAKKYQEICHRVRAQLLIDKRELEIEHSREGMLLRFYGPDGDDGSSMLDRCLPNPFPIPEWEICKHNNDLPCLSKMLDETARSIR